MKIRNLLLVLFLIVNSIVANAQYSTIAYVKVLKSENENSGLFYSDSSDEKSLIEYILENADAGEIKLFNPSSNISHEFDETNSYGSNYITKNIFHENLGYRIDTVITIDDNGNYVNKAVITPYNISEIEKYIIIENRSYSADNKIIDKKIVGIMPVRYFKRDDKTLKKPIAWVYFPELKPFIKDASWYNYLVNCKYKSEIITDDGGILITPHDSTYTLEFNVHPEYCPKYSFSKNKAQISEYQPQQVDLSKVKYVKFVRKDISINNEEYCRNYREAREYSKNKMLFYPTDSLLFGTTNMINLILDAVFKGKVNAYSNFPYSIYYDIPTFDIKMNNEEIKEELGEEKDSIFEIDPYTGEMIYTIILEKYNSNEIKKYSLTEFYFYDYNNQLISKQIIGIMPLKVNYDYEEVLKYHSTFWLKFDEIAPILASKKVFKYTPTENRTFLDVLNNDDFEAVIPPNYDKYYAEEYGIDTIYLNNLYVNIDKIKDNKIIDEYKPKKIKKYKSAKIVTIKVDKNKQNLPLFMQYEYNLAYLGLFDYIFKGIFENNMPVYKTANLSEQIDTAQIKINLGEHYVTDVDETFNGLDTIEIKIYIDPRDITSFVFKELWLYNKKGKIVVKQIISICPVREYYREDDLYMKTPLYKQAFWIDYNDYSEYFKKHYVNKVAPIEDETFYEYLQTNKYQFEILNEEKINFNDAETIINKTF